MNLFEVKVILRIITTAEDNGNILIFLDENGNLPSFTLSSDLHINAQIYSLIQLYFYESDIYSLINNKQISSIDNNKDKIDIVYNILSQSDTTKKGSFVRFNKQSIELYRLMNNNYQS